MDGWTKTYPSELDHETRGTLRRALVSFSKIRIENRYLICSIRNRDRHVGGRKLEPRGCR